MKMMLHQQCRDNMPVSKTEKAIGLSYATLAGAGLAFDIGFGVYGILITDTGAAGAGVGILIAASTAMWLVPLIGVICFLFAVPFSYFLYKEYMRTAEELTAAIEKEDALQQELLVTMNRSLQQFIMQSLRCYALLLNERKNLINKEILIPGFPDLYSKKIAEIYQLISPGLRQALIQTQDMSQIVLNRADDLIIEKEYEPILNSLLLLPLQNQPSSPHLLPLLPSALMSTFGIFSIFGTAWGVAAVLMASFTTLAVASPLVGLGILGGCALLAITFGVGALFYCQYKNAKRESQLNHLADKNRDLVNGITAIKEKGDRVSLEIEVQLEKNKKQLTEKNKRLMELAMPRPAKMTPLGDALDLAPVKSKKKNIKTGLLSVLGLMKEPSKNIKCVDKELLKRNRKL